MVSASARVQVMSWQVGRTLPYCTVSVTAVEWTRLPAVPVIVSTELPVGVFLLVETVSVEEPEPVTEAGLKLALDRGEAIRRRRS